MILQRKYRREFILTKRLKIKSYIFLKNFHHHFLVYKMDLKAKKFKPDVDENGRVVMNQRYIKRLCEEQGLYLTPSVNDKLYLHFKGFSKIQNLEEYINLCTLYLENNLIRAIEGLDNLKSLRFLYLHNNMIKKIE